MNTPNKLTLLRISLVPIFLFFMQADFVPLGSVWATIVFIVASLTDFWDGHLARKNNLVTTFGKFLDPLADKVLVVSALICFIPHGYASAVAVVIIIAREFLVTSLRLVAVDAGIVIAASIWGKVKTVIQMLSIIAILLFCSLLQLLPILDRANFLYAGNALIWLSTAITVISGIDYMVKNRRVISANK